MSAASSPVVIDLQAAQSVRHGERGIARYAADLVRAIARHHPSLVHEVLLDPARPPPAGLEDLGVPVVTAPTWGSGSVFHILSPFELDIPVRRLWPREASRRGMRTVVTVYDLIPEIMPDVYLQDAGSRRRYRARRHLVRAADAVMAISTSAAEDTVRLLGIPADRVTVVGAAPAPTFVPPLDRTRAAVAAGAHLDGLERRFVLYTGGAEPRKNLERLLQAYAALPSAVRAGWQLVVVCKLGPLERNHVAVIAARLGIEDRVLLTGYVGEDALLLLYQGTDLVVFPSLYEGYGLPVAEGLACGAPVIASATSSLVDLLPPDATFDPYDTVAMGAAIAAALTDPARRSQLSDWARRPVDQWADVADRTAAVYRRLAAAPSGGAMPPRPRPRVALASPMPPAATPVAAYSARLLRAIGTSMDVDVYSDSAESGDRHSADAADWPRHARTSLHPGALPLMDSILLGYDATVVGTGAEVPVATCVRAANGAPGRPLIVLVHGNRLPDPHDLRPEARYLFTSRLAWEAARAAGALRTGMIPFAYPSPIRRPPDEVDGGLIGCFADVDAALGVRLVEAFSVLAQRRPALRLALVGRASEDVVTGVDRVAGRLGVASRVALVPATDETTYRRLLGAVAVAVQPGRDDSPGLAECLARGIPTVVIGIPPPGASECVSTVAPDGGAVALAVAVRELLDSPTRRADLASASHRFVTAHGYDVPARYLLDLVERSRLGSVSP